MVADILTLVDTTYWNLVAARRDVASIESSVELAVQQLSETKSADRGGVLGETDIAQPTAELERRGECWRIARQRVRIAENALRRLILGDPSDPGGRETLVPADAPRRPSRRRTSPRCSRTAWKGGRRSSRPQARRARSEIQVDARNSAVLPRVDLVAAYGRRGLAGSANPTRPTSTGSPIDVPPPLGNRSLVWDDRGEPVPDASVGRLSRFRSATAPRARIWPSRKPRCCRPRRRSRRSSSRWRRTSATPSSRSSRHVSGSMPRRPHAPQPRPSSTRSRRSFAVGLSTNFFVLTRQNDLTSARVAETSALTEYRKAETELARATGTLLAERQIHFDQMEETRANGGSR